MKPLPLKLTALLSFILASAAWLDASEDSATRPLWRDGDLSSWVWTLSDPAVEAKTLWEITDDGNLLVHGFSKGYLRNTEVLGNYRLHIEWRWAEESGNGGILVNIDEAAADKVWPACYQLQLKTGHVGELIAMEGAVVEETVDQPKTTALLLSDSNESPHGEWNVCEVVATDGLIEFYVNGVLQNRGTAPSLKSGYIGLQLEGKAIEYRNASVTSL